MSQKTVETLFLLSEYNYDERLLHEKANDYIDECRKEGIIAVPKTVQCGILVEEYC